MSLHSLRIFWVSFWFLFIFSVVFCKNIQAQEYKNFLNTSILEDKENDLTMKDILKEDSQKLFQKNTQQVINLGNSNASFWIKFYFVPPKESQEKYYLDISNGMLDEVQLFLF
jgi:hypothetical protein